MYVCMYVCVYVVNVNGNDGSHGMDINKIRKALCGKMNNFLSYLSNVSLFWNSGSLRCFVVVIKVQFCGT